MSKLNTKPYTSLNVGEAFMLASQAQSTRLDLDEIRIKVDNETCVQICLAGRDPICWQLQKVDQGDAIVPTQIELRFFGAVLKVYQQMGFGIWKPKAVVQ